MNPITTREFFGILRMPRASAALLALAVCFALLVLARWPSDSLVDLSGAQSRQVFRMFAYGMLGGVLLLAPAFPSTSIVREKQTGTLALLLNSPLTPLSIYFGKLGGSSLFTVLLLSTSLPAAAACFAMGGIDLRRDVGMLYGVLALLALECVALGLLVSTLAQSAAAAVRITYAAVFGVCFATLGPHYLLQGQEGLLAVGAHWLRRLSPLPLIMEIAGHASAGSQGLIEQTSGAGEHFLIAGVFTVGVMVYTILQLNHRLFDRVRSQGKITNEQSLAVRSLRRLWFLVDPQRRTSGIPRFVNPVMVKEFRTRKFGRIGWLLRLVSACAVLSLLLTMAATTGTMDWGVETIGGLLVMMQVLLIVLITPSLSAGLISSERETGGWDLLRMTPLAGYRILTGKLFSALWTLLLVLLATAPGYLVMVYIKPSMWLQVYLVMGCLLITVFYTLILSAAVGSCFSTTAASTVAAYAAVMAVYFGPLLVWLGREAPFGHGMVQAALALNPMGAALSVIEMPGFAQYELIPLAWWVAAVVCSVALAVLGARVWRLMQPT